MATTAEQHKQIKERTLLLANIMNLSACDIYSSKWTVVPHPLPHYPIHPQSRPLPVLTNSPLGGTAPQNDYIKRVLTGVSLPGKQFSGLVEDR